MEIPFDYMIQFYRGVRQKIENISRNFKICRYRLSELDGKKYQEIQLNKTNTRKEYVLTQLPFIPKVIGELIMSYDYYYFEGKKETTNKIVFDKEDYHYIPMSITCLLDGRMIVSDYFEVKIQNHKTRNFDIIHKQDSNTQPCMVTYSEGLIITEDTSLVLWNYKTNKRKRINFVNIRSITSIAKTISNDLIVFGSFDKKVRVWNMKTKKFKFILKGHTDYVWCLAIISDKYIVSGSSDKTIRIWDIETGLCKCILSGHRERINDIAVLSDEESFNSRRQLFSIISCSYDKTVRKWILNLDNRLFKYKSTVLYRSNDQDRVNNIKVLPDKKIACNIVDMSGIPFPRSTLRVIDSNINNYDNFVTKDNNISTINILPDGRLVSGSISGCINIWR
jgi:WD40 repeat protein